MLAWWRGPRAPQSGEDARFAGRFRLGQALGRGAAGEVWSAWDDDAGGRPVALKLWAPLPPDAAARARFDDECRLRQRLAHPDIQRLLDHGVAAGRPWMALEWVDGHDLACHTSAAQRLPMQVVARLGARIAAALAHAHAQGICHRDLKPANVLVNPQGDVVKLIDFGVARQDDDPHRTRTGTWVGTPAYMAPELLAGAPADARTDIYALGVLLFELLAARRPFDAPNLGELLRQVAQDPAPDLRHFRPDADAALAEAVARALHKDRSARWPDANSLAQTLARPAGAMAPGAGGSEAQSTANLPARPPSKPPTR